VFAPLVDAVAKAKALLKGLSVPARVMVVGTTVAAVLVGGFIAFNR